MKRNKVSKATLGRLPKYLKYLQSISLQYISSATIARDLNLGEVQVRKDLNQVSGVGKPKIGYLRKDLIASIEKCLGRENTSNAIIIGAGKLGKALLNYEGFEEYGIKIIAAFDHKAESVNEQRKIYSIEFLKQFCEENSVQIGVIAVSSSSAQEVCNLLIENNIKAIWNFAPINLEVPKNIIFVQENLALSLAHLNNQLINSHGGNNEVR